MQARHRVGALNCFKAGQRTLCSVSEIVGCKRVAWPPPSHRPAHPWSHAWRCGPWDYPGQALSWVLELENVDRESLRMDEEWLDPWNVGVEGRAVTDMVTSIY